MSFFRHFERAGLKRFSLGLLVLCCCLQQAQAQSGRRAKRPQPVADSVPAPPPTTTSSPTFPTFLSKPVRLLVGCELTHRHLQSEDAIYATFVNRLNQFGNVTATSIGNVKRKQIIERAKTETDALVVFLNFSIDRFQSGTIILNSPDLQIEYFVFEPGTGKKKTEGKVYFQSIGGGRMRRGEWPSGTPIKITAEAAGLEIAEHVHDWLRLNEIKNRHVKQ